MSVVDSYVSFRLFASGSISDCTSVFRESLLLCPPSTELDCSSVTTTLVVVSATQGWRSDEKELDQMQIKFRGVNTCEITDNVLSKLLSYVA